MHAISPSQVPIRLGIAFAKWHNDRIHGALDLECGETPNEAFIRKIRGENLLGMFLDRTSRAVKL
jgi:hypothetical protein